MVNDVMKSSSVATFGKKEKLITLSPIFTQVRDLVEKAVDKSKELIEISGSGMIAGASNSIQSFDGSALNPYEQSKFRLVGDIDELYMMPTYLHNYLNNPYVSHHVNYQFSKVFGDGWHVDGPGAEEINAAFEEDGTYHKLNTTWFLTFLYGIGYMEVFVKPKSKQFKRTRQLNPQNIAITINTNVSSPLYGEREYREFAPHLAADWPEEWNYGARNPLKKLNKERLLVLKNRDIPFKAYPPSPVRFVLPLHMYLYDIIGDIAVAIKHVAYSPIIAKIDTSAHDEMESTRILTSFADQLNDMQSAGENLVCDKDTDIGLIGNLGGGGGNAQMMNVVEMMRPLLTAALANGSIPLGVVMQDTANQATLSAQLEDARVFFEVSRDDFRKQVEAQLFPHITDKKAWIVFDEPPFYSEAGAKNVETIVSLYNAGVISREYVLNKFGIRDEGTTFIKDTSPNNIKLEGNEGGDSSE